MKKITLNKLKTLDHIDNISYEPSTENNSAMEEMSLARSMLKLAGIDHESEFGLCREIAGKLLGKLPEPEDL